MYTLGDVHLHIYTHKDNPEPSGYQEAIAHCEATAEHLLKEKGKKTTEAATILLIRNSNFMRTPATLSLQTMLMWPKGTVQRMGLLSPGLAGAIDSVDSRALSQHQAAKVHMLPGPRVCMGY